MSRISNGLTGQALRVVVQAEENRTLSIQDLAVKCGYVTARGTARVPQYKVAVSDASGVYFGKTIPGDVPAQRAGTTNRFKAQKNGILVTAKRFLTEIDVIAGTYANVMVAEVESGDVIDVSAFTIPEGTKVVLIVKNHDPVMEGDEDSEEEEEEEEEEDDDEDTEDALETPTPSPTFIPDPLDPTPAPMTTTVRLAQPVS